MVHVTVAKHRQKLVYSQTFTIQAKKMEGKSAPKSDDIVPTEDAVGK